jgi:surface protein
MDPPRFTNTTLREAIEQAKKTNDWKGISKWDVSQVTNMEALFADCTTFNENLDRWDVSQVTTMKSMFSGATTFNQNLDHWNISNVDDMDFMFWNTSLTISFPSWIPRMEELAWTVKQLEQFIHYDTDFGKQLIRFRIMDVDPSYFASDKKTMEEDLDFADVNVSYLWTSIATLNDLSPAELANQVHLVTDDLGDYVHHQLTRILPDRDIPKEPFENLRELTDPVMIRVILHNVLPFFPLPYQQTYAEYILHHRNEESVILGLGHMIIDSPGNLTISRQAQQFMRDLTYLFHHPLLSLSVFRHNYVEFIVEYLIDRGLFLQFQDPDGTKYLLDSKSIEEIRRMWFQTLQIKIEEGAFPSLVDADLRKALDYWYWDFVLASNGYTLRDMLYQVVPEKMKSFKPTKKSRKRRIHEVDATAVEQPPPDLDEHQRLASFSYRKANETNLIPQTMTKEQFEDLYDHHKKNSIWWKPPPDYQGSPRDNPALLTDATIKKAVKNYLSLHPTKYVRCMYHYGFIWQWDVSQVTNMANLFENCEVNPYITLWNVSQVTNMAGMFYSATSFNQPIGKWDVSNVREMSAMFYSATSFNQPIGKWDVSNVREMSAMFYSATSFNQPIGKWDVSNVTDMSGMFFYAQSFNQPLEEWDVSHVTDMSGMFFYAQSFNQPLAEWNVTRVTNMSHMFWEIPMNHSFPTWIPRMKQISPIKEFIRYDSEFGKTLIQLAIMQPDSSFFESTNISNNEKYLISGYIKRSIHLLSTKDWFPSLYDRKTKNVISDPNELDQFRQEVFTVMEPITENLDPHLRKAIDYWYWDIVVDSYQQITLKKMMLQSLRSTLLSIGYEEQPIETDLTTEINGGWIGSHKRSRFARRQRFLGTSRTKSR